MNNIDLLIILYDYYENLLTDSQKKYFEKYYFENLSLSEISENENVSRNAISKELKLTKEKLIFYEKNLKLYEKEKKLRNIIDNIDNDKIKKEIYEILDE